MTVVGLVGGIACTMSYASDSPRANARCGGYLKAECLESCGCALCHADGACYPNDDRVERACPDNATATPLCEPSFDGARSYWIIFGAGAIGLTCSCLVLCVACFQSDECGNDGCRDLSDNDGEYEGRGGGGSGGNDGAEDIESAARGMATVSGCEGAPGRMGLRRMCSLIPVWRRRRFETVGADEGRSVGMDGEGGG